MFCQQCGADLPDAPPQCPKCGADLAGSANQVTSGKAVASLVFGLLGVLCLWLFTGIPAIIYGLLARRDISRDPKQLTGEGMALSGIILGAVSIVSPGFIMGAGIIISIAIPSFIRARETSRSRACQENLAKIDGAKEQFALDGNLAEGATVGLNNLVGPTLYLKSRPQCPAGGTYTINRIGQNPTCSYTAPPWAPQHEIRDPTASYPPTRSY